MTDRQFDPREVYDSLGTRWVRACDNPIGGTGYIGAVVVAVLIVAVVAPAAAGDLFAWGFGTCLAAVVWLFLRTARMGVYIARDGVLVRSVWSPELELDWESVDRFEVVRRNRMGAAVDQVRVVASGSEFWLPLVIRNIDGRGLQQDVDDVASLLEGIRDEATAPGAREIRQDRP